MIDAQGAPETAIREDVQSVQLSEPTVAKANTSASDLQEYWHHLPYLPHNTEHRVHITTCNQYGCSNSIGGRREPHVIFKTAADDGK